VDPKLADLVAELGHAHEQEGEKPSVEIERRFIVPIRALPEDLYKYHSQEIKQGYFTWEDEQEGVIDLRLRQKGSQYYLTRKVGAGLERVELEKEITPEEFSEYWPLTEKRRIEKTRFFYDYAHYNLEIDIYHGPYEGKFASVEVEFGTPDQARMMPLPVFLHSLDEVTDKEGFSNEVLSRTELVDENLKRIEAHLARRIAKELELEEGLKIAEGRTREHMFKGVYPVLLGIGGGSASGKSSQGSEKLAKRFKGFATIIAMDNYYKGRKYIEEQRKAGKEINYDHPDSIDTELLLQHLAALSRGESIEMPTYSFKTGERLPETITVEPNNIIIIEGLYALLPELSRLMHETIFINIGEHELLMRRIMRDKERTGEAPKEILRYLTEVVHPMYKKFIEATKENASILIRNPYKPEVEAHRSGLYEVQLKFEGEISSELLEELQAQRVSISKQYDTYYNPRDRDLNKTGESVRIREESGEYTFSYKGQKEIKGKNGSLDVTRPKLEFVIDADEKELFEQMYGDQYRKIEKKRTVYSLDGCLICIDRVHLFANGELSDEKRFIEIKGTKMPALKAVAKKLGLDPNKTLGKSYLELLG
jgi:uridine kinase